MKKLGVHPIADLFPMLADDELAELADDIRERGLLQPIVLDTESRILDGRNRLAACDLADVEPTFTTYDGDDPGGYALAVNIARRHLTKGQIAMVAARSLLVSNNGQVRIAEAVRVSQTRVAQAKTVLDHAPDLADSVISGSISLDAAYETARKNKAARDSREAQMARLRAEAPDLADLVIEERMTLGEAIAAMEERTRTERERKRRLSAGFGSDLVRLASVLLPGSTRFYQDTWDPAANPHRTMPDAAEYFTPKGLRRVAEQLTVLADYLDDEGRDLL